VREKKSGTDSEKKNKKFLTSEKRRDKISELLLINKNSEEP